MHPEEDVMGFGKNPHVAKAQAAQLKAEEARDSVARQMAWREAAHLWERAARQEQEGKRKAAYEANAGQARERADTPEERPGGNGVGALVLRIAELQGKRGGPG